MTLDTGCTSAPRGACTVSSDVRGAVGAYGLRIAGVADARAALGPACEDWPTLRVTFGRRTIDGSRAPSADHRVQYRADRDILVTIDRHDRQARFELSSTAPEIAPAAVVHPLLFGPAAVTNHWMGRQAFHAGAFAVQGGAWAVIGRKGSGKSSTLACLALRGVPVLTDDLLVVDDGRAFAGPSCIDLRTDAAAQLGVGRDLGVIGARRRWRLDTAGAVSSARLRGWIFVEWGDRCSVEPTPAGERIPRLWHGLAMLLPKERQAALLDLATLPSWIFTRPRGWRSADSAIDRLLTTVVG